MGKREGESALSVVLTAVARRLAKDSNCVCVCVCILGCHVCAAVCQCWWFLRLPLLPELGVVAAWEVRLPACDSYLLPVTCSCSRTVLLGRVWVHYKLMRHFAHNLSGFGFGSSSVLLLSLSLFLLLLLTRVIFHAVAGRLNY